MFTYERVWPVHFEEHSSVRKDGYTTRDGFYASPYGGNVPAYVVVPHTEGPCPAVIFMHPGQGNRTTFLPEAETLAARGVVSLLLDAPFLRREAPKDMSDEQKLAYTVETVIDTQQLVQTIVDIRRGIDLLSSLENVDSNRIAYIGHSFGATWGGVLAGIEKRVKAYVLMAGFSSVSEWHRTSQHPLAALIRHYLPQETCNQFISALEPLDAVHYIKDASPAALFFQFVYDDEYVSKSQADTFYDAASLPKEIVWYETDHLFTGCDAAYQDRTEWLIKHLSLPTDRLNE